ncbi:hypothetical protein EGR_08373 [Echinococcus granulosus]|uniref:Uncharacterized protein n=1 Tax=Echinococcus granulosus TaxID=6210 RepID=W6U6G7_ECHGR|nr:hypothetical protein EGR_08373 [Echinococcus granulosus]EUB56795.1 hypothetical protein EGR_08373 [Echinococcus granulosus]
MIWKSLQFATEYYQLNSPLKHRIAIDAVADAGPHSQPRSLIPETTAANEIHFSAPPIRLTEHPPATIYNAFNFVLHQCTSHNLHLLNIS